MPFMTRPSNASFALPVLAFALLLVAESAWALRCGSRIVKEGMFESEVVDLCGEPATVRRLGYVLRPYIIKVPSGGFGTHGTKRVYSGYHQELEVRELLFNFGPHKLMRVMRFEGGRLVSIETAGYGYRGKK
jgi:hypothetical protein